MNHPGLIVTLVCVLGIGLFLCLMVIADNWIKNYQEDKD